MHAWALVSRQLYLTQITEYLIMPSSMSLASPRNTLLFTLLAFFTVGAMNFAHAGITGQGAWVSKQYEVNGAWQIEKRNGQTVIKFSDDFSTRSGPDLKLFLSKNDISGVTGSNASGGVMISKLKNVNGYQEYIVPGNVNIDDFASLVILCEKFSVLWGGANL